MHSLYFVRLKEAENAREAIDEAVSILGRENFANSEGGYWSSCKADWFVAGGRWSGELHKLTLKRDFFAECKKRLPSKHDFGYSTDEIKANKDQLQAIWEELGGTNANPYIRDSYQEDGYDDDAIKLNKNTASRAIKLWPEVEVAYCGDGDYVEDELMMKDLKTKDLEGSWLVVIDYHN